MPKWKTGCAFGCGVLLVLISFLCSYYFYEKFVTPTGSPDSFSPILSMPPVSTPDVDIWPPPQASGVMTLPWGFKEKFIGNTMEHIDFYLRDQLYKADYYEFRYYNIPQGFALITRLERIELNGKPSTNNRWNTNTPDLLIDDFTIKNYLKALFLRPPGNYRIFIFFVTNQSFKQKDPLLSNETVDRWMRASSRLATSSREIVFSKNHDITLLVYEFENSEDKTPEVILPGKISPHIHLRRSGLDALVFENIPYKP